MRHNTRDNKESGLVSIFTVIFFMIFISVITIGFIKIMGDEARQATDNDLTASALSSAQTGAEEAKRVLLYCKGTTLSASERARCVAALNKPNNCKAVTSQFRSFAGLGLNIDADDEGIVTNNQDYQQRYTCLTIQTQTPSVEGVQVPLGSSKIIPLRSTSAFNQLVFYWHGTSTTMDGAVVAGTGTTTLSQPDWNAQNLAAMMRLEVIAYPKFGVDLAMLSDTTRTVFLSPASSGLPSTIDLSTADPRNTNPNARPASSPRFAPCNASNVYACQATINLTGLPSSSTHNYILRVTSIYRGAHIKMILQDNGTPVNFDDVQPVVDVTGRTNDVFRRIQSRVEYASDFFMPEFALGSASPVCKLMTITDQDATSSDACPVP